MHEPMIASPRHSLIQAIYNFELRDQCLIASNDILRGKTDGRDTVLQRMGASTAQVTRKSEFVLGTSQSSTNSSN
jgi:hypothetical protein